MAAARKSSGLAKRTERAFGAFLRPLENLRKNPRRAMASPRTTFDAARRRMKAALERQFSRESPEGFLLRVLDLIPPAKDAEVRARIQASVQEERATLQRDPVGAALLALYDDADRAGPVSPVFALLGALDAEAVDVLSVNGKLMAAERSKNEKRALALLEAVPDLFEKVYARHLRTVWMLSFLTHGAWPSRPPWPFGRLVMQTGNRLKTRPGLVQLGARNVRNAVAHRHAEYEPSSGRVVLRDPIAKWQITPTLDEFGRQVHAIWRVSVAQFNSLRSIAGDEVLLRVGLFDAIPLLRRALRGDPMASKELADRNLEDAFGAQLLRQKPAPGTDLWFLLNAARETPHASDGPVNP